MDSALTNAATEASIIKRNCTYSVTLFNELIIIYILFFDETFSSFFSLYFILLLFPFISTLWSNALIDRSAKRRRIRKTQIPHLRSLSFLNATWSISATIIKWSTYLWTFFQTSPYLPSFLYFLENRKGNSGKMTRDCTQLIKISVAVLVKTISMQYWIVWWFL